MGGKTGTRIAWGITGSGDRLVETVKIMGKIKGAYEDNVEIKVYLSKAGYQVVKYYELTEELQENFGKFQVERDSNSPFLAGGLQLGTFEFLLIAPTTSNTVAKISLGIADTLLSNAAIMALKAFVPVYTMPSDYEEGLTSTKLPKGRDLKIRIRKEDAENVKKLVKMEDVYVIKDPQEIYQVFLQHFKREVNKDSEF